MTKRPATVVGLCGLLLSFGHGAHADDASVPAAATPPALEGHNLRITSGTSVTVVDLGCEGRSILQTGDRIFVACGSEGVVVVDLSGSPRRIGSMPTDGDATGFFLRGGRVWVETAHVDAHPLLGTASPSVALSTADVPAPPPPPPPPPSTPIRDEDEAAPPPPPPSKPGLLAPPRRGELWEVAALAGAYINLGPTSGGVTGWASVVYRFDIPLVIRAELSQFGLAFGNSETVNINSSNGSSGPIAVAAAHLLVGLDTEFIEVALGGGAATLANTLSAGGQATGGPTIVEEGRFGARDGLALNLESVTVAANGQFQLGSFVATVQVPLTPSVMLMVRGGGGNEGLQFGDLGARVIVHGDGGPGTLALTGFFGGAGIDFQRCLSGAGLGSSTCQSSSLGGPSIGGGFEWRR